MWEFPVEDWQWSLNVNLMGVVHGLRAFVPRMIQQGSRSHILNTASLAGFLGGGRSPVYSATRHAVVHVTEALYTGLRAIDAPVGVTVLCPGQVRTGIYQSERNRPSTLLPDGGQVEDPPKLRSDAPAILRVSQEPGVVAEPAFAAIEANQFYLITSHVVDADIQQRFEAICDRRNPSFRSEKVDVRPAGSPTEQG